MLPILSISICAIALAAGWWFARQECGVLRRMIAWRDEEIARLTVEIRKLRAR